MRVQPLRVSSSSSGSPGSAWLTCSASSRGSARRGVTSETEWKSNVCSPTLSVMQLRLDAADRLVELVEERRVPLGAVVSALTGLTDRQLRGAPPPPVAVRRFLAFAGDAVLVAHNARFDLAFLDRETERLTGSRLAAPVVDTVPLARRLLAGRVPRAI